MCFTFIIYRSSPCVFWSRCPMFWGLTTAWRQFHLGNRSYIDIQQRHLLAFLSTLANTFLGLWCRATQCSECVLFQRWLIMISLWRGPTPHESTLSYCASLSKKMNSLFFFTVKLILLLRFDSFDPLFLIILISFSVNILLISNILVDIIIRFYGIILGTSL